MKDRRGDALVWYGTMKTLLPVIFAFVMLYSLSSFLQPYQYQGFQPLSLFYTIFLVYIGITFVLESLFVVPHAKIALGLIPFVIMIGLAISSFVFAFLLFTGVYDGIGDNTLNGYLTFTLVIALAMYVFHGREEFFHHRRFSTFLKAELFR